MRALKIATVCFIIAMIYSCVSNRKYKDTVSDKQTWQERYARLNADFDDLQEWKTSWENRYSSLESNFKKVVGENHRLEASLGKAMKENELASFSLAKGKNKSLSEEERNIVDIKSEVDAQFNALRKLKEDVTEAMDKYSEDELQVQIRNGKLHVSMSDKLLFPSGSDVVDKRGKEAITLLASVLTKNQAEIIIEGHTDKVPVSNARNKDNWDLSVHRATSVTRIFTENGISPERIVASGRAEFHPLAGNETAGERQLNRRTEIVLAPNSDNLWNLIDKETTASMSTQ